MLSGTESNRGIKFIRRLAIFNPRLALIGFPGTGARTLFSLGRLNKYLRRLPQVFVIPYPAPPVLENISYIEVRCKIINVASLDYVYVYCYQVQVTSLSRELLDQKLALFIKWLCSQVKEPETM